MKIPLDAVEGEITRLWEEEARKSAAPRIELMTAVALVSDPALLERAQKAMAELVRLFPSRTILAFWHTTGEPGITAEVGLHRSGPDGPARGDAITLEATGGGREWLPENVDRLALPDLPVCLWWVGDLPDFDHLFDALLGCASVVVVNSGEMDLRDLGQLAEIAKRSRDRYSLSDLTWTRLRPLQELVARFFDDEAGRACIPAIDHVHIDFVPRPQELDVASTQAGLLFGWIAYALSLPTDEVTWARGEGFAEATLGRVKARFEARVRDGVPPGTILRVALRCAQSRFEIERQDDPQVLRWSRDVPGAAAPPQTVRVANHEEPALLVRCLERPKRDRLLEASLGVASRALASVAPRLSRPPV